MRRFRVYVDTSVIGGCFDEVFTEDSKAFLDRARSGKIVILVSDIVIAELETAPPEVRNLLPGLPSDAVEFVPFTKEAEELRDAYIAAGVVGRTQIDDAAHVATATVSHADAIVSWNFRHIVRLDKIKAYNAVNLLHGYGILTILSPKEVVDHGSEDEEQV